MQATFKPPVKLNLTLMEEVFDGGNAFLSGSKADLYAINSSECYNRMVGFYFNELPLLQIRYYYGDTVDQVFNTTLLVQNVSQHVLVCSSALQNYVTWNTNKALVFPTATDYFLAMFQNLLANIISFTNIYYAIEAASGVNQTANATNSSAAN